MTEENLSRDHAAHPGAAFLDRAAAGAQLGMEQMPDMDHLGPDLQIDPDIRGAGAFR